MLHVQFKLIFHNKTKSDDCKTLCYILPQLYLSLIFFCCPTWYIIHTPMSGGMNIELRMKGKSLVCGQNCLGIGTTLSQGRKQYHQACSKRWAFDIRGMDFVKKYFLLMFS